MLALGWKYNMTNIEAALLSPQFHRIEEKLDRRTRLAKRYDERMGEVPELSGRAIVRERRSLASRLPDSRGGREARPRH